MTHDGQPRNVGDPAWELDVDGDGRPDVAVPGLPADEPIQRQTGRGDSTVYERMVDEPHPPTASALDPMGRIEQQGYALQSAMLHPGWRRTALKVWAYAIAAAIVVATIAALLR